MDDRQKIIEQCYQVPGQMWPAELGWLYDNFASSNAHVEIGTYCGRSLLASCGGMSNRATVLAVDPDLFELPIGNRWIQSVRHAPLALIKAERGLDVTLIAGLSTDVARQCAESSRKFDSIFIDGNHNYAECRADIEVWRTRLKPGGLLAGHDYWPVHTGVMEAVNETLAGRFQVAPGTRIWWARL